MAAAATAEPDPEHRGRWIRPAAAPGDRPPKIPNYLVPAILSTVFCCIPTGIVSIVYASQVNTKVAQNDLAGALKSSQNAKVWAIVSVGAGLVILLVYFVSVLANSSSL